MKIPLFKTGQYQMCKVFVGCCQRVKFSIVGSNAVVLNYLKHKPAFRKEVEAVASRLIIVVLNFSLLKYHIT